MCVSRPPRSCAKTSRDGNPRRATDFVSIFAKPMAEVQAKPSRTGLGERLVDRSINDVKTWAEIRRTIARPLPAVAQGEHMGKLDNRIAAITGAGSGIGAATARLFAAEARE
jgi:hypothetical protein